MQDENDLSELSKTLFIPLAARAKETTQKHPILSDTMAVHILNHCDTAGITVDGGVISTHGILARTSVIDTELKVLLSQNPNAVVINLGAGLDTRFFRLDNGTVQWYDLDLPSVISFRKKFICENERLHFISESILSETWVNHIPYKECTPVIIIAEGLLMYFSKNDIQKIFKILISAFPNANMLFDVVHSYFIGKGISNEFLWGIKAADELKTISQNITVIQSWSVGKLLKQRQSLLLRVLNIFPSTRNRSQIIHIKLKG